VRSFMDHFREGGAHDFGSERDIFGPRGRLHSSLRGADS
jgi:hypothetical protein